MEIIIKMDVGVRPHTCTVYIFQDKENEGKLIGCVIFETTSQVFKPRIRDLDKGSWNDLMLIKEKGIKI